MPLVAIFGALLCSSITSECFAEEPHVQAEGATDAASADEHHATGVPLHWDSDLVLWSIVTFVLFLIVLRVAAWKPLIAGLDQRESNFRALLADAQADRDKAVRLLGEYEQKLKAAQGQVDEIIAEARRDAERTKADIVAAANSEAEATRRRALDDIGRARDQAIASMFDHMQATVLAATEKVLARQLTDDDHTRLISEALAEVSAR